MAVPSWCIVRVGPWRDALLGLTTALPIHRPKAVPGYGCLNSHIPVCQIVGGALSPLLANLYMRRFIVGWKRGGHEQRLDARIVNYADDFVICCKAGRAVDALQVMRRM